MNKRFIPCIYLYKTKAVKFFTDKTVVSEDPVELASKYADAGADEIVVFDLSSGDEEHEKALTLLRKLCAACQVPVIGAGNVNRMEDIKKLLYAGCMRACLNYDKQSNVDITAEVSKKFGKDKIMACFTTPESISQNQELVDAYISELICVDENGISKIAGTVNVPFIAMLPQVSLDKALEYLGFYSICGISGSFANENYESIQDLKHLCLQNGIDVNSYERCKSFDDFKKLDNGLVPVVVQDYKTNQVLMVAYMNKEAYEMTLKTGKMTYFSRSRNEIWIKGETSGHYQYVKALYADCDTDTILAKVYQVGAACHTGAYSCFFDEILKKPYDDENPLTVFNEVYDVIKDRKIHPKEGSYTNYLFEKGIDKILKKCGEEATEIVIAAKNPNPEEIKYEIADFLYHVMVLMAEKGLSWEEITTELANR